MEVTIHFKDLCGDEPIYHLLCKIAEQSKNHITVTGEVGLAAVRTQSINTLMVGTRVANTFRRHRDELKTIGDLLDLGSREFLRLQNIGKKTIKELNNELAHFGIEQW